MTPEIAIAYFSQIYKVINNEQIAKKLDGVIKMKKRELFNSKLSINYSDNLSTNWDMVIFPRIEQLLTKKCMGIIYVKEIEDLSQFIISHKKEIFPSGKEANMLVASYLLNELGAHSEDLYQSAVQKLKNNSPTSVDTQYLYALTHIIFINSRYFDKYVNPVNFQKEIVEFNRVLALVIQRPFKSDIEEDVIAEILISLKLLKQPMTRDSLLLYSRLMDYQNKDGSWGNEKNTNSGKLHHTTLSILALIEFSPHFRIGNIYYPIDPID